MDGGSRNPRSDRRGNQVWEHVSIIFDTMPYRTTIGQELTSDLFSYKSYALGKNPARNFAGNHKKSLHLSVRDSLKKLKTDYVSATRWRKRESHP